MTLSINYPGPEPEPGQHRWGGPKPEGYAWPSGKLSVGLTLTCLECGAAVTPDATELHTAWHQRLARTLP